MALKHWERNEQRGAQAGLGLCSSDGTEGAWVVHNCVAEATVNEEGSVVESAVAKCLRAEAATQEVKAQNEAPQERRHRARRLRQQFAAQCGTSPRLVLIPCTQHAHTPHSTVFLPSTYGPAVDPGPVLSQCNRRKAKGRRQTLLEPLLLSQMTFPTCLMVCDNLLHAWARLAWASGACVGCPAGGGVCGAGSGRCWAARWGCASTPGPAAATGPSPAPPDSVPCPLLSLQHNLPKPTSLLLPNTNSPDLTGPTLTCPYEE